MDLMDQLKQAEGLRLKPYRCPEGRLTIGYGRNLEDAGITEEVASYLLENDVVRAHDWCWERFGWFRALEQRRHDVVVEMVFQVGPAGFLKFKRFIAAMAARNHEAAAREIMDSEMGRKYHGRARRLAYMMAKDVPFEDAL